jgi:hypothetical protein
MAGYNEFSGNSEEVSDMPMNENLKSLLKLLLLK